MRRLFHGFCSASRTVVVAVLALFILQPAFAGVEGDMLIGSNLPGSDFQSFPIADGDPAVCARACEADGTCAAWTFVKPGIQDAQAMCWLKTATPAAAPSDCCISGIERQASLPPGGGQSYPFPVLNDAYVDWCATAATDCGQPGADQFCATQGFARASGWAWFYTDRTWIIGSGIFCESAGKCGGLSDVVCTNDTGGSVPGPAGTISVTTATYGANCGVPAGNSTQAIAAVCNGQAICNYTVDYTVLGDPASGCAKDFIVEYSCSDGVALTATADPEAGFGSVVTLSCQAN